MADLLQTGAAWLAGKLSASAGQEVSYRRASASVTVNATLGSTLLQLGDDQGGVRMERTDRDFIITAADLVLSGAATLPEKGDTILHDGRTYEVLAPGDEPVWRWSDPHRTLLRIHTKLIAE